jgi:hypothetical protein
MIIGKLGKSRLLPMRLNCSTQRRSKSDHCDPDEPASSMTTNTSHYCTFSTAMLAKLLDRAAGDTAEHRAIQDELRRQEIDKRLQQDKNDTATASDTIKPDGTDTAFIQLRNLFTGFG